MRYRRNADRSLRELERRLSATNSEEDALSLYYARRRIGDPRAGYDWYSWLYDLHVDSGDFAEPDALVWAVDDKIYCNECGEDAAFTHHSDDIPTFHNSGWPYDDPDYHDFRWELAYDWLRENFAYDGLVAFLRAVPNLYHPLRSLDRNKKISCHDCGNILKLDNRPITWNEALIEPQSL
jgi:hypothetical protein